jgi:hypothetical protein
MTAFQTGWVETYTGTKFYPFEPNPEHINLLDIAHPLSQMCRFTGHCEFFYSVAQHSINCAKEMMLLGEPPRMQLYALMHDASEAYLQDIARPIKSSIGNYEEIEAKLMDAIWDAFGIPRPSEDEWQKVKQVDDLMLLNEAKILMKCKHWDLGEFPVIQNARFRITEMSMRSVEAEFMQMFSEIVRNDFITFGE